jgi:hypothetical protein
MIAATARKLLSNRHPSAIDRWRWPPGRRSSRGLLRADPIGALNRGELSRARLDAEDEDDFNEMRDAVNRAVGRTVLVTVADTSQYRFTKEAYSLVRSKVG